MDPAANRTPESPERRAERRIRALKGARIIFNRDLSVFDCTVRNLSPSGALLEISSMLGIPPHFDLAMDQAVARRPCTVRWHTDRMMGVLFDDAVRQAA